MSSDKEVQPNPSQQQHIDHLEHKNLKASLKKFMLLRLDDQTFALPLSDVREVLGLVQLSPLPDMPAHFAGLINLRGKVVSAIDLKKSLQCTTTSTEKKIKKSCVIITESNGQFYGAIVDDILEVVSVPEQEIDTNTESLRSKEAFTGLIKNKDRGLAPILNMTKALKINEIRYAA